MSQAPNVYGDRLRRLAVAFGAGYPSCPPLRHAVLTGIGCGVNFSEKNWGLLLRGEGHPWKWYALPDFERGDEPWPSWRACWFTDWEGADLTGAWKAFLALAGEAARCRYGLLKPGNLDPEGSTFIGEEWVAWLHRLAWRAGDPVLKAERRRFHRKTEDPDTLISVAYEDSMAADPEMMAAPLRMSGREIQMNDERAPLAFPHRFMSVLAPDLFQASAYAVELILEDWDNREAAEQPAKAAQKTKGKGIDGRMLAIIRERSDRASKPEGSCKMSSPPYTPALLSAFQAADALMHYCFRIQALALGTNAPVMFNPPHILNTPSEMWPNLARHELNDLARFLPEAESRISATLALLEPVSEVSTVAWASGLSMHQAVLQLAGTFMSMRQWDWERIKQTLTSVPLIDTALVRAKLAKEWRAPNVPPAKWARRRLLPSPRQQLRGPNRRSTVSNWRSFRHLRMPHPSCATYTGWRRTPTFLGRLRERACVC